MSAMGKYLAWTVRLVGIGLFVIGGPAWAAAIYKANNDDDIDLTTSWWTTTTGTTNPASITGTDTLWFGNGMGATRTLALGGDLTAGAIRVDNNSGTPNYGVTISAGNTLTLNGNSDYGSTQAPQGIVLNSSAGGPLTINANLALANTQTFVASRNLTISGDIALGANTLRFWPAAGTTTVSGTISGTGGISRVQSNGGGLVLSGTNTYTGTTRIDIGSLVVSGTGVLGGASGSTSDAGNIVFGNNVSNASLQFETVAQLGDASQVRFRNTGGTAGNGGVLRYVGTTDQTLSKTIQCDTSIGIRLESDSVGGSLTFNGAFSQTNRGLYLGGTGEGPNTLATGFSGTGSLTKRGAGTWILSGANAYSGATTVSTGTLLVNGSLGNTSGVSIASGSTLGGSGSINAVLSGAGLVSPGNSPGITTATGVDPSAGTAYAFEFTATGSPTYSDATASVNDVLRLTDGTTPFVASLSGGNVVDVYFDVASLAGGDSFKGGFYTDLQADFLTSVENGSYAYWVKGNGTGTDRTFNGQAYFSLSNFDSGLSVTLSTVAETANFAGGSVNGQVMEFAVVPEPSTLVLTAAGLGLAGLQLARRRR